MVKGKGRAGRKKVEIKRIEKKDARDVCFSKRRQTLFNKAGELSLLCNANIAAVVISPAGRGFSFAHPSVDDVADRLASMAMGIPNNHSLGGGYHDSGEVTNIAQQQKIEYVELQKSLEKLEKKKRVQEAMEKERAGHLMQSLTSEVNLLGQDELEELHNKLSALPYTSIAKFYQVLQDAKGTRMPLPQPHIEIACQSQFLFEEQAVTPANADFPGSST
uniref:MADS-box domain-containing protein n=1 Tax=Oryza glumipatula TaxID=40148 RepID=A0A0D9ZX02_9ORYZ